MCPINKALLTRLPSCGMKVGIILILRHFLGRTCQLCEAFLPEIQAALKKLQQKHKDVTFLTKWTWEYWLPSIDSFEEIDELEIFQRREEVINDLKLRSLGIRYLPALLFFGFPDFPTQTRTHLEFWLLQLEEVVSTIFDQKLSDEAPLPSYLRPSKDKFKIVRDRFNLYGINPRYD